MKNSVILLLFLVVFKLGFTQEQPFKKIKFGGRIMIDHAFFNQNKLLDQEFGELVTKNGTEIRRARLFVSGEMYENVFYKLQADFSGGSIALKDAYIGIKHIPVFGNILIGHVKEPIRLESSMSSKHLTFMERAFPESFMQIRNNGILISNVILNNKANLQLGAFRNSDITANNKAANQGYSITTRIAGKTLENLVKKRYLHLGLGLSYRKPDTNKYSISTKPEAHLSSVKYVSTDVISNVKSIRIVNFETAFVLKSFAFQGEYLIANVDKTLSKDNQFSSHYGQLSFFLTGESKNYKTSQAVFSRVNPLHNFGSQDGFGAVEVALRYSKIDLNSYDVNGGVQSNVTLGLNWYLNPTTKLMLNKIWATVEGRGKLNIFQARFQIDF